MFNQLFVIHVNDTNIVSKEMIGLRKPLIVLCILQAKQVKKSFRRITIYNLEMNAYFVLSPDSVVVTELVP